MPSSQQHLKLSFVFDSLPDFYNWLGAKDHQAALAMGILRRKAYEAIRSSLQSGMDFSKARRELHEMGFRATLYVLSGKSARAASKK